MPRPCAFCGTRDDVCRLTMPWHKGDFGWWCCGRCRDGPGTAAMYKIMAKRRVVGVTALPEWFLEHQFFRVRRTNGSISLMKPSQFICNEDSSIFEEGRLLLNKGDTPDIYLDMCTDSDDDISAVGGVLPAKSRLVEHKQVALANLLQHNPELLKDHAEGIQLRLPPWVSEPQLWQDAVDRAVAQARPTT